MALSLGGLHHLPQLIGWDQRMPECTARLKQTACDGSANRDRRNADDLRCFVNFVRDARQRFIRSVPVTV
jgi:hypothetical protein